MSIVLPNEVGLFTNSEIFHVDVPLGLKGIKDWIDTPIMISKKIFVIFNDDKSKMMFGMMYMYIAKCGQ